MTPLVSVLIPAFNVSRYIEEAVESIRVQTYKNIEIIIIDDCSSDNTFNICEKLSKQDSRIKISKNDVNSGIAITLNKALDLSVGEYIVRMDADDISIPNRIEKLFNTLIDNDKLDLVGSDVITIDEDGNNIGVSNLIENNDDLIGSLKYSSPVLHIWMCKRKVYEIVGYYKNPPVEDYDFLLRCVKKGIVIHNVKEGLYKVRLRSGNTVDLYGYKQLKAFEETYKAFENSKYILKYNEKSVISDLQQWLYKHSRNILMNGSYNLKNKKYIKAFFLFLLSALMSTYQFRYLYRRLRLFIYKKKLIK